MGNLVTGMWRKCVAAVLGTIVTRPGVRDAEIVRVLWPGLTIGEVEVIAGWLVDAGVVDRRAGEGSSGGRGEIANFVRGRFWWGLVGGGSGGRNVEENKEDRRNIEAVEVVGERREESGRLNLGAPSQLQQQEARVVEIE